MSELDEVIGEFLVESYENLDRLDQDLVALEDDVENRQLLAGIFRTIHTIKGTCGFLGFTKLEALTHAGENLLSKLREGEMILNPAITSALLAMVDGVRQMLACIESAGNEGDGDYTAITQELHHLLESGGQPAESAPAEAVSSEPAPSDTAVGSETAEVTPADAAPVETKAAEPAAPVAVEQPKPEPVAEPVVVTPVEPVSSPVPQAATPVAAADPGAHADSTIRVDVSLLDTLMNLVGELVLARNQIVQVTGAYGESDLATAAQRLNMITTELQEGVMKTRMQPIGNVLSKFPRVVRDIAVSLGKQVRIELEGKETELDKTINEAIKDPLTHLVRNSVDHGLEMPDVRVANGKPAEGRVVLRAFHEGGQVNIEIEDDGAGIDHEKIKAKALEKGLITQAQADRLGEREALQLIFLPGFSTAEKVSNISGRGVGMDVVKTNIESIGGTVDVATVVGKGTVFKIRIPLTLAIIPALLVGNNGESYAIPQVSLVELLRLESDNGRSSIESIHGAPVLRLRGNLLPLCHLGHELSGQNMLPWSGPSETDRVINVVVLQADGRQFGLVVDDIRDTQEIVVKPLDAQLKNISAFAGATIMGDGRVALILDVMGMAQKAHVVSEGHDGPETADSQTSEGSGFETTETLLLVEAGNHRVAVPLSLVARLEEFPRGAIETAHDRSVVQYRGEIMPLVNVAERLGSYSYDQSSDDTLHVIVYSSNGRSMGLLVDNIVDIVVEKVEAGEAEYGTGVRGSAVIQGKVTDIVDVVELVRSVDDSFFDMSTNEDATANEVSAR
jgi:two-component system, chemotaxis family, sensor kinase CheA